MAPHLSTPDIAGADSVIAIFGYWPSFHDAEVHRLCFERTDNGASPVVELDIHAFEITDEVAPNGLLVLRHHVLITFRLEGVAESSATDFGTQNVLMGMGILDIRHRQLEGLPFEVVLDSSFGLDARFLCRDVRVVAVRPFALESGGAT